MQHLEISGSTAARFADVRQVFEENFRQRGELGASVCVWHEGQKVVDLWGGHTDRAREQRWQENTLTTIFSATKGLTALCFLLLHRSGAFCYDDAVAKYWPEFACGGKDNISIRTLLNHRSGLVAIDKNIALDDLQSAPQKVAHTLATQVPHWPPGRDQGYHGTTFGLYAAVLFRNIANVSLGEFLRRQVCEPWQLDLHLGLDERHEERVSRIFPASKTDVLLRILPRLLLDPGTDGRVYRQVALGGETAKAFAVPEETGPRGVHNFNTRRVHAMELPWANGIGNARSLATLYNALLATGGNALVAPDALAPLLHPQSWSERDRVLRKPMGFSQGFIKESHNMFSPNPESFGHPGAGGALGWCDPVAEITIGYVPNKMSHHIRSPRARALCAAAYRSLS